ncbi:hypothetical protein [Capnocytophaga sp.]|uniref:hypothetical protein n=1 Tax=Capnocytophaga sp. TaxID=44737 RepID=UPI0026DD99DB|nr:hypothetical protein [Capnocytophaga sp.]MDO5106179.1 hypothetical protein [Capnocytophaga sp.]
MKEEFEKLWGRPVPVELRQLIEFQEEESDFECYSQGFGVETCGRSGLENGWSDNPDFLAKLYPFAQANGSGSIYAIWDDGSGYPLGDMPVVVFGDEGGEWVVARYFSEFLQLLTFDTEIMALPDSAYFWKDEDEDDDYQSDDAQRYRDWFCEHYDYLSPVDTNEEAQEIIDIAQQEHQQDFNNWLGSFEIGEA